MPESHAIDLLDTMKESEPRGFDWDCLIPQLAHPLRVPILEAMTWLERPLSLTELREIFERDCQLAQVFYAVKQLQEAGMVEATSLDPVRGAAFEASYALREAA